MFQYVSMKLPLFDGFSIFKHKSYVWSYIICAISMNVVSHKIFIASHHIDIFLISSFYPHSIPLCIPNMLMVELYKHYVNTYLSVPLNYISMTSHCLRFIISHVDIIQYDICWQHIYSIHHNPIISHYIYTTINHHCCLNDIYIYIYTYIYI